MRRSSPGGSLRRRSLAWKVDGARGSEGAERPTLGVSCGEGPRRTCDMNWLVLLGLLGVRLLGAGAGRHSRAGAEGLRRGGRVATMRRFQRRLDPCREQFGNVQQQQQHAAGEQTAGGRGDCGRRSRRGTAWKFRDVLADVVRRGLAAVKTLMQPLWEGRKNDPDRARSRQQCFPTTW